jgi:hypothetical protein
MVLAYLTEPPAAQDHPIEGEVTSERRPAGRLPFDRPNQSRLDALTFQRETAVITARAIGRVRLGSPCARSSRFTAAGSRIARAGSYSAS